MTTRQAEILEFLRTTIAGRGFPPTRREIKEAFGFKSANAAEEHLQALARHGAITLIPSIARGIRLVAA